MNIKEQFPKTYEKLKLWVKPKLEAFVQNVPGIENNEPIEITDEWLEKFTDVQVKAYQRSLFDFTDDDNIYVIVDYVNYTEGKKWYYIINDANGKAEYKNRTEAENAGIEEAFKRLEEII